MQSARRRRTDVANYRKPRVKPHIFKVWNRYYMQDGQVCTVGHSLEECRARFLTASSPEASKILGLLRHTSAEVTRLSTPAQQLMVELVKKDKHLMEYIEALSKM